MRTLAVLVLVAACDTEPPKIIRYTPSEQAKLHGAKRVHVIAEATDESDVTAELIVGGASLGKATEGDCEDGCMFEWVWDSSEVPEGNHDLQLFVHDSSGNDSEAFHTVLVDDVITVKAMQVANIVDESGLLEMEVYVTKSDHVPIGCAGGRHGLAPVDQAGTRYTVDATIVDSLSIPIGTAMLPETIHLEVWEDDDDPVCPEPLDGRYNDLVGTSTVMTMEQLRATPQPMAFGNVTELVVAFERPYTLSGPTPPSGGGGGGGGGFGGGGCNSGSSSSLSLAFVAVLLAWHRRRRRCSVHARCEAQPARSSC